MAKERLYRLVLKYFKMIMHIEAKKSQRVDKQQRTRIELAREKAEVQARNCTDTVTAARFAVTVFKPTDVLLPEFQKKISTLTNKKVHKIVWEWFLLHLEGRRFPMTGNDIVFETVLMAKESGMRQEVLFELFVAALNDLTEKVRAQSLSVMKKRMSAKKASKKA